MRPVETRIVRDDTENMIRRATRRLAAYSIAVSLFCGEADSSVVQAANGVPAQQSDSARDSAQASDQVRTSNQSQPDSSLRRVTAPDWKSINVRATFFDNAFRDGLVGPRPAHLSPKTTTQPSTPQTQNRSSPPSNEKRSERSPDWASIISPETIENEIKRLARQLDDAVKHPATFAGGGYQDARQALSMLAILFAVVNDYDGEVRWMAAAAEARDRFAYCASILTDGKQPIFQAASSCQTDLNGLLRGERLGPGLSPALSPVPRVPQESWIELVDRNELMNRLEQAYREGIKPALQSANEMVSNQDRLVAEAEVTAAISQFLMSEPMEQSDDAQYVDYCKDLQRGALAVHGAVQQNDFAAATKGATALSTSCSDCHESFR